MSENEVDEISNEYTRTIRSIFAVVREYIAERGPGGSERLSRTERRQLAEAIRIQVGEQGIGKAWFTKRLDDYHAEAAATAVRHRAGDLSAQDRRRASERLSGMRFGIESSLHDTGLSLAQRGQVVRGLDAIDRDPHQPMTVFAPLTDHDAIQARWAAVQSENTVLDRRIGTEKPITAHRPPPVDEAQTARGHAENGRPRKRLTHTREGQPTRSVVAPTDRDGQAQRGGVWRMVIGS